MLYEGPDRDTLQQLAPIMVHFKISTSNWMMAMEQAFSKLDHENAMKAMNTYKEWLDEVATPMIERIRQIKGGEKSDPIPPGNLEIPGGW